MKLALANSKGTVATIKGLPLRAGRRTTEFFDGERVENVRIDISDLRLIRETHIGWALPGSAVECRQPITMHEDYDANGVCTSIREIGRAHV